MGIDRDEDGHLDGDELEAGTSRVDPLSHPGGPVVMPIPTSAVRIRDPDVASRRRFRFLATSDALGAPSPGSAGDPTVHGATVRIYNAAGSGEQQTFILSPAGWRPSRSGYAFRARATGITAVRVTPGRLKIRGAGTALRYALDEPAQRRMVVRVTLGTGIDWCGEAAPLTARDRDVVGRFEVRAAPPPAECQAPPAG
jgi:hypothetical protein